MGSRGSGPINKRFTKPDLPDFPRKPLQNDLHSPLWTLTRPRGPRRKSVRVRSVVRHEWGTSVFTRLATAGCVALLSVALLAAQTGQTGTSGAGSAGKSAAA